ncbi:DNA replication endonuclease-helicase Dna2 [Podospora bellae-mahoneyi]|uniref:DNA replication ATP-dependent helicase/nuclease n=1 Tax=Podospora bellae-mahoneyi TaxID=2093777 RepID=A0ABR0FHY3_9PEZI|nr:DNA replication endonuclease-helicase Dna2 [Podospora bellae-mahoneyi]
MAARQHTRPRRVPSKCVVEKGTSFPRSPGHQDKTQTGPVDSIARYFEPGFAPYTFASRIWSSIRFVLPTSALCFFLVFIYIIHVVTPLPHDTMPPLQKSYSDSNKLPSKRSQWQRSKTDPNPAPPKPALRVSSKTKTKLKAFQFDAKDCESAAESDSTVDFLKKEEIVDSIPQVAPQSSPSLDDVPKAAPKADQEDSPSERLMWANDINPHESGISTILLYQNRKRRARSSSPVSSPITKGTTPAAGVRKTYQGLGPLRDDPTSALWGSYNIIGTDASPSRLANPSPADLMVSSSPRPARDGMAPGSQRSLRKTLSLGRNWPKRRKLGGLDETELGTRTNASQSKSVMVEEMLKTVGGELSRSFEVQARKSSSQGSQTVDTSRSRSPSREPPASSPLAQKLSRVAPDAAPARSKTSSDYGDDDFDDDTLMELDATILPTKEVDPPREEVPSAKPQPKSAADKFDDDEFDDFDVDFLEGAENLITQIEAQHASQSQAPAQQQAQPFLDDGGGDDDDDAYGGGFDDDDFDDADFDAMELAATQGASAHTLPTHVRIIRQKPKAIQRYLITNVLESSYVDDRGRESEEKVLWVEHEGTKTTYMVHLRGDWVDTQANPKAYVHIIGDFEPSRRCIIDNNHNIIILHPDQLISSTVIADSFTCMRRAVLQDRVKATSEATPALVYGTILHEVFQAALMANEWTMDYLRDVIDKTLQKHMEDIYVIKVSMDDARNHLVSKMPELRSWAQAFVSAAPQANANVQGRNGEKINMCVSKLLDVEEHVWSPMYGLKGNIDATVQVTMREGNVSQTLTVPFEVKTGKNATANHQAQTVLYNLLLSDRYDIEIAYGILYYMETSQTLRIPAIRHELRHMIMQRNALACYIRERSVQLPPMKRSKNACERCYAQTSCFIYHKLADGGNGDTSGLNEKFEAAVQHLSPRHQEFFLKWEDLLTKEEKESQKLRRELWTMVSTEREKVGRCFANVIIEEGSAFEDENQAKINRFTYTFIKESPAAGFSFMDSQLQVGEPIVVSDEQGHFALALGYVTAVRKQRISVAVDRRLHNARIRQPGFDEVHNQVFASIMEVAPEGAAPAQSQGKIKEPPIRYRLDKDEFSNGMATVRNNLVQIMTNGPQGFQRIRQLVVDLIPPSFKSAPTQYSVPGKNSLNVDQKAAVEKVMSAKDYALVLGMPGTGKTTTIAHIIRALIGQGKTLLLTSYTHTAVDNILLKLKDDKIPILRLGAPAKVHPEVRDFVTLASQPMSSFDEIRRAWHGTPVVATTCLGVNHPVFNERVFDYCIVDEASQITLPICLGPIRMARTFVLVGDHNQLPPLVQNNEARIGGLDVSLFKLLSDAHPSSVVNLEHQYRMSEDIMTLSNTLIYKGRLKCGTESLRNAELHVPHIETLKQRHHDAETFSQKPPAGTHCCPAPKPNSCWLHDLITPTTRVKFINTDLLPDSQEQAKGNRIVNPTEAKIITQLVDSLVLCGVPAEEIGVMTHYRSQLALLKYHLRGSTGGRDVEMHTADRFQGRDKSVILLSLVRSNDSGSIGELLKDWRRINVAFTRAKVKLLVVGSKKTLLGEGSEQQQGQEGEKDMIKRFVELMVQRQWVYDLGREQFEGHYFSFVEDYLSPAKGRTPVRRSAVVKKMVEESPLKGRKLMERFVAGGVGGNRVGDRNKENVRGGVSKQPTMGRKRIGERMLTKGGPVVRDILNELMG